MDKAKKIENIETLNTLAKLTIEFAGKYMKGACENASNKDVMSMMGSQATYLYNMATIILDNTHITGIDKEKLIALAERMPNLIKGCADELGMTTPFKGDDDDDDDDDDEDEDVSDESIDEFAKECKLNKTETAVLRKIVKAKGNPTNMTKKDEETALKMASKIAKAGKELNL